MKNIITLILTAVAFIGCARPSHRSTSPTPVNKSVTINGDRPEDYYTQFYYRVIGKCDDEYISFQYLDSLDIPLEKSSDNKPRRAKLRVYLKPDHTFNADYEERKIGKYVSGGYIYDVTYEKSFSSTWDINPQGELVLNGIGVALALQYNDSDALLLKGGQNAVQSGIKGGHIILRVAYVTFDKKLIDAVCKDGSDFSKGPYLNK